ncbi:hypothetical protein X474_00935 [Dethiosulfatarculus sandiegensis]|uniref:Uncharacterized protein n=1 Tax=Dethiosulfatarculus sandiegensis TaxID=1429043 RepID=A0A0D2K3E3_9BACT|nr:hypothetical protein X474_00935 [Dethiosulfatarculus sandiegensis]
MKRSWQGLFFQVSFASAVDEHERLFFLKLFKNK